MYMYVVNNSYLHLRMHYLQLSTMYADLVIRHFLICMYLLQRWPSLWTRMRLGSNCTRVCESGGWRSALVVATWTSKIEVWEVQIWFCRLANMVKSAFKYELGELPWVGWRPVSGCWMNERVLCLKSTDMVLLLGKGGHHWMLFIYC